MDGQAPSNVSLAVHDSKATVCLHYKRDTTTWSMHCCHFAITQLYMKYKKTVNYLEHLEAHFNGQCMNWHMYTYSTLYTINACICMH